MKLPALKQKTNDLMFCMGVVVPTLFFFTLIRFYPIADTLVTSFFKKSMIRPGQTFIGIQNYLAIFADKEFYKSLGNTGFLALFSMLLSVGLGLFLAIMVNDRAYRGMRLFQSLLFLPVIVSMVPATLMWKMLFDYNTGVINYMLGIFGAKSIDWINNPGNVRWSIVIVGFWKEMGYNMMIFYVGLKAIPAELYESASMDGAGRFVNLRCITLPQLRPITLFIMVISTIKFVKIFTQALIMTSGSQSSGDIFKTLVYYIYQQGFQLHSMGRASAAAMVLLAVVFVLTWVQLRVSREK